jgi:sugar/nucleoside kinase (ribokinase family)
VVAQSSIATTEISQVPLSGVLEMLTAAKSANVLSILDVDVSPSVAVNEARLGSHEELLKCVFAANILKPAKHAAEELLLKLDPATKVDLNSAVELAVALRAQCDSQLVALTNGASNCTLAINGHVITLPSCPITTVTDATGAGDAFLGGLLAGMVPLSLSFFFLCFFLFLPGNIFFFFFPSLFFLRKKIHALV